jgi:VanZ family protein
MELEMLKYRKFISHFPWIIVVLWMFLIFSLSAQPAQKSDHLSIGVTEKVAPGTNMNLDVLNHVIRKNAHFFIYLVLAIMVQITLTKNRIKGIKGMLFVIGICLFFAMTDEFHQLFVLGRGAQVKDVLIDSAGAIVGLVIFRIDNRLLLRFQN